MAFATPSEFIPHVRTGRIRALAVNTATRLRSQPELPTLAESGASGFEVSPWHGVLAPAAAPRDIVAKLNREFARILRSPEMVEYFSKDGLEPMGTTAEQFGAHIRAEIVKWKRVAPAAGLQVD